MYDLSLRSYHVLCLWNVCEGKGHFTCKLSLLLLSFLLCENHVLCDSPRCFLLDSFELLRTISSVKLVLVKRLTLLANKSVNILTLSHENLLHHLNWHSRCISNPKLKVMQLDLHYAIRALIP